MRDWLYAAKDGDPKGAAAVKALAEKRISSVWDDFEARLLRGQTYLMGPTFAKVFRGGQANGICISVDAVGNVANQFAYSSGRLHFDPRASALIRKTDALPVKM